MHYDNEYPNKCGNRPPEKCKEDCCDHDHKYHYPCDDLHRHKCKYEQIQTVLKGESLYESQNTVIRRVNTLTHEFDCVMDKCHGTLKRLESRAFEEGAYYSCDEVTVEEGYSAEDSTPYKITRIKRNDASGRLIKMDLHLAYNNTTNSGITEDAFEASMVEYADKMYSAIPLQPQSAPAVAEPMASVGWFGKVIWRGIPVPTRLEESLFTVAFTKCGQMKWYNNTVSDDQLRRDTIVSSMGVYGVLVHNEQLTPENMHNRIPYYNVQKARVVMGQNYKTKETYVLTCGGYEKEYGMRSETAANILIGYGCDVAVELCQSSDAVALDKGQMMFVPDNANVPSLYAYWFVSKECTFKDRRTYELAALMQRYGVALWKIKLNKDHIDFLYSEVKRIEEKFDKEIADLYLYIEEQIRIINERIDQEVAKLNEKIDTEVARLDERIDEETAARIEADNAINARIDAIYQELKAEIARIDAEIAQINQEISDINAELTVIKTDIANIKTDVRLIKEELQDIHSEITSIQAQMTALNNTITNIIESISTIEQTLENIKQQILDMNTRITNNTTKIEQLESGFNYVTGYYDNQFLLDGEKSPDSDELESFTINSSDFRMRFDYSVARIGDVITWKFVFLEYTARTTQNVAYWSDTFLYHWKQENKIYMPFSTNNIEDENLIAALSPRATGGYRSFLGGDFETIEAVDTYGVDLTILMDNYDSGSPEFEDVGGISFYFENLSKSKQVGSPDGLYVTPFELNITYPAGYDLEGNMYDINKKYTHNNPFLINYGAPA